LLAGLVDYAGLFPPASLPMPEAVVNYARYRSGNERWVLGRCVVPAARLDEFAAAVAELPSSLRGSGLWELSVLLGAEAQTDVTSALAIAAQCQAFLAVRSFEARAESTDRIVALRALVDTHYELFCELPLGGNLPTLVAAVRAAGAYAKVRTGGVTAAEIPEPAAVLEFLSACAVERVAFKATAGLHHAVRGDAPLTYEPRSECATMFGHLNVLLAATACWQGRARGQVSALLTATGRSTLTFGKDGVRWGSHTFARDEIAAARRQFVLSIGSCSFTEPVDELRQLGVKFSGTPREGQ
jgi:hypothetical protein